MDDPELYVRNSSMQREDAEAALAELIPCFSWGKDEHVLDVGCGPGNVTVEVLLPLLPDSTSVVGIDVNSKMVDYANNKYASEKVSFKTLDFGTRQITQHLKEEEFSKLFSFFCLHWIQDSRQVAENIRVLLKPGGEFVLFIVSRNGFFTVYRILSEMDQWKAYLEDVEKYIPSLQDSADPCEEMRQVLTSQGLEVILCEDRTEDKHFGSVQELMKTMEAVNPFVKRMGEETRSQFLACYRQKLQEFQVYTEGPDGRATIKKPLLLVYGRRPFQTLS